MQEELGLSVAAYRALARLREADEWLEGARAARSPRAIDRVHLARDVLWTKVLKAKATLEAGRSVEAELADAREQLERELGALPPARERSPRSAPTHAPDRSA